MIYYFFVEKAKSLYSVVDILLKENKISDILDHLYSL